ncbi:cell surface protein [Xylocopilactobacillus apicola]|uniref:Cell surface protein n=1 Tax=Xylocopilactobacillus apicola TaxID=2932184 RepID=A0AAU9CV88_9LACO|nr:cell surface protein [Xylocopilactobacillus apicola]
MFVVMLIMFFLKVDQVNAADAGIFSVKPIFPENQISKQNSYYLLVKPGQKQTVSFYISNLQNKSQTFRVEAGMYVTNSQGDMVLTTNKKDLDSSLPVSLLDMKVKPTLVTVPAQQTVQVNQEYQIPAKQFKGLIYGGVRVTSGLQSSVEVKKKSKKGARTFVNTYGRMDTGIIMTMDRKYPKGDLKVKNVTPVAATPSPVFNIKVQNPQGTIIDSLNLKAKIEKDGIGIKNTNLSKVSLNSDYYRYTVAPYSNFTLSMNIGKKRLVPGQYTLKLTGKSHGHEFKQDYKFMVTKNSAQKINKDNSNINPDYTWLFFIIIIGIVLILIAFIIFMYFFGMKKILKTPDKAASKTNPKSQDKVSASETKKNRYGKSNVPKRQR